MQLYNKLSSDERSKLLDISKRKRITLSFYKYAHVKGPQTFRDKLFVAWNNLDVLGRIYVASEGINAQLSLPNENFLKFQNKNFCRRSRSGFNSKLGSLDIQAR